MADNWYVRQHQFACASDSRPWCVQRDQSGYPWPKYYESKRGAAIRFSTKRQAQKKADELNSKDSP